MRKSLKAVLFGLMGIGMLVIAGPARDAQAFSGEIFELKGSGKLFHFETPPAPGQRTFVNNISAAGVVACITGGEATCSAELLERDTGGKAYLYLDSLTSWRVATNKNGQDTTSLTGLVGGDGVFMMTGAHQKSGTQFILQGKVTFQRGTLTPTGIKNANITGVSSLTRHFGTGKFSTVGPKVN